MVLKAEGVSKNFIRETENSNIFEALEKTDFELKPGELTVLVGLSGSGKTTLMNILAGLLSPDEGKVMLDGTDLYDMEDKALSVFRNRHFGIIPQGQTAISTLTVLENVILPATIYKNAGGSRNSADNKTESKADLVGKAETLLGKMGILYLKNVFPKELSGGELRRVSIARALINEPEIIFADEPTSDLDEKNTELVFDILKGIAGEGKAVLAVTHEHDAGRFADRIYRMDEGVLKEE